MNSHNDELKIKIEEFLSTLTHRYGEELISQVKPILANNLEHHRLDFYDGGDSLQLDEYIVTVINNYSLWHEFLFSVQIERDVTVWESLLKKLIHFAYQYFLHKNFDSSPYTHEIAEECATKAAEAILLAQFPYDSNFDAWARRIVQFKCLKFMSEEMQKRKIPADMQVEYDEELENSAETPDMLETLLEGELRSIIEAALKQIPESRRNVIIMRYFEELPPNEIAKKIGKSIDAVYSLHFNALQDLRKIFIKTGIILNE